MALILLAPIAAIGAPGCHSYDDPAIGGSSAPPMEEVFDEDCIPASWTAEAQAHPEPGVSTSIALEGSQVRVEGDEPTVEIITAPLTITPDGLTLPLVAFQNVTVNGVEAGTLVLIGDEIIAGGGRLALDEAAHTELTDTAAWVTPYPVTDDGTRPDLGTAPPAGHATALDAAAPFGLVADELRITAYEEGYLVTGDERLPVAGTLIVSATRVYWGTTTSIGADSITARWDGDVSIGMTPSGGSVRTQEGAVDGLPQMILGRDAHLEVGPDHVRTVTDMPVRQALDEDGPLLASRVELRACEPPMLVMAPGESRTLRLAYRQPGNLTDATFVDAWIEDVEDGARWDAQLEIDDSVPEVFSSFAEAHSDSGWGSVVGAFFGALVEIIGGIIGCIATLGLFCGGDDSDSGLARYPGWMEPNQLGRFEVVTSAPWEAGTYEVLVRIAGHNYDSSVAMTVVVVDE